MEAKFSILGNHPWISFINSNYLVWDAIISKLKPMDIVSLALATFFRIRPSPEHIGIYMKWWKQIFYNMRWVEQNGRKITIIGKDLARLKNCLETWTYDPWAIVLLVVVQETLVTGDTRDDTRQRLLQSISKDIPYASTDTERLVQRFEIPIQMCVLFLENNIYIDLDQIWLHKLLKEIHPIRWPYIQPWPDENLVPTGLEWENYTNGGRWFETWYVDLNLPDFVLDKTITRPELALAQFGATPFDFNRGFIRIAIAGNGSVVIPHLAYWLDTFP